MIMTIIGGIIMLAGVVLMPRNLSDYELLGIILCGLGIATMNIKIDINKISKLQWGLIICFTFIWIGSLATHYFDGTWAGFPLRLTAGIGIIYGLLVVLKETDDRGSP